MVVNFQRNASKDGAMFRDTTVRTLEKNGWAIIEVEHFVPDVNVTLDILASSPGGVTWPIECKGGYGRKNGGFRRSDNVLKMIGEAALLSWSVDISGIAPMLAIGTYLPNNNGCAVKIEAIPQSVVFAVVSIQDENKLEQIGNLTWEKIQDIVDPFWRYRNVATAQQK